MDFSKLTIKSDQRSKDVDPIKIFGGLTLRGNIDNIWGPQEKALVAWHDQRQSPDIAIEMNTGGGKTLVGLIAAQSLVNETSGCVLYVCPTIQLVEQTFARAEELGIAAATYADGKWNRKSEFDARTVTCITTYAAVFNGLSIFRAERPVGLVFDDAHVAGEVIRDSYSLRIAPKHKAYRPVANLFRGAFVRSHREQLFDTAIDGDTIAALYVPMFEVVKRYRELHKILQEYKVHEDDKWAWEHLKDHLYGCCVLVSGSGIEITPPALPTRALHYFSPGARRIYMTATIPLQTDFVRTFGAGQVVTIKPEGKSGEAQRLFLTVPGSNDEEQRKSAKELVGPYKTCVISPSTKAAGMWVPPAELYDGKDGDAGIRRFAQSSGTEKLALAARFDGIDLPGKSCRVLVLDGLPRGNSLFRTFIDQTLGTERLRTSSAAIRITQAIGRIFRSNTDHGAVVICGYELQRWLRKPENQALLPELLQRQVQLGFRLLHPIEQGETTFKDLLQAVLKGEPTWDEFYSRQLSEIPTVQSVEDPGWLVSATLRESAAYLDLWDGHFEQAREGFRSLSEDAGEQDKVLAAWWKHWSATCSQLLRDDDAAFIDFSAAATVRATLGRPSREAGFQVRQMPRSEQANRAVDLLATKPRDVLTMRKHVREWLEYGPDTSKCEQALSDLGRLLGFEASRPDKAGGTGPDVLWVLQGPKAAVGIEAKTDKTSGEYKKSDEIGQEHDHRQWMLDNYLGFHLHQCITGKVFPVSLATNPPEDLRIIPLDSFKELASRVEEVYVSVSGLALTDTEQRIESLMRENGLKWPEAWKSLEGHLAIDLKGGLPAK